MGSLASQNAIWAAKHTCHLLSKNGCIIIANKMAVCPIVPDNIIINVFVNADNHVSCAHTVLSLNRKAGITLKVKEVKMYTERLITFVTYYGQEYWIWLTINLAPFATGNHHAM